MLTIRPFLGHGPSRGIDDWPIGMLANGVLKVIPPGVVLILAGVSLFPLRISRTDSCHRATNAAVKGAVRWRIDGARCNYHVGDVLALGRGKRLRCRRERRLVQVHVSPKRFPVLIVRVLRVPLVRRASCIRTGHRERCLRQQADPHRPSWTNRRWKIERRRGPGAHIGRCGGGWTWTIVA